MNPMTNVKNIKNLSEKELKGGLKTSWHDQYKNSAWIFVGGLPYDLTEGDLLCVFSQFGEPVNINLVRDKDTGKSKGFCFLCYEDQRSTNLAVDNFNGIKLLGRTIRVDHVENYKPPKNSKVADEKAIEMTSKIRSENQKEEIKIKEKKISSSSSKSSTDSEEEKHKKKKSSKKKKRKKESMKKNKKKKEKSSKYSDSESDDHKKKRQK